MGQPAGPLAGLPLGVKDLEDTAGMVTSYGSIPFKDNRVEGDSIQVARLKAAGAIVVGKLIPGGWSDGGDKNMTLGSITSRRNSSEKLKAMAAAMRDEAFIKHVAQEIVERTQPQRAIPEAYGHYRSVVRDGIEFFLSQVDRHRLMELVVSQLKLDPETGTQERLLELAKRFPTLHKLGQIIARNPNIDPVVKKWLIHLENGCYGTPLDGIMERIGDQLEQTDNRDRVQVQPAILSEASVGAVIAFNWNQSSSQDRTEGVFKILKPGIRRHLDEELLILEKTAAFFEENRHKKRPERYSPLRQSPGYRCLHGQPPAAAEVS